MFRSPAARLVPLVFGLLVFGLLVAAPATAANLQDVMDWLASHADAPVDGLAPGTYGVERLDDLTAYLAPGLAGQFDFPDLRIELTPSQDYPLYPVYAAATERFAGQASIGADGRLENYTAGRPFSTDQVLAADAVAGGFMVAWNQIHRWQNYGYRNEVVVSFIQATADGASGNLLEGMEGGGHVERSVTMFYHRVYFSRLAQLADADYRLELEGADELLFKEYIEMLSPFDIAGLKLVVERPLDQTLGDQVNSYLPTERRVRRLSAKERSDSWIGTNWTLDDFEGFSGLVMDNDWRYLGRKVVLHVASSAASPPRFHGPTSTIPLDRWQLRPCFVVEAVPRWDGHPYGRRIIFVDEQTGSIPLTLVFDREDRLVKTFATVYAHSDDVAAPPAELSTPRWRASIGVNLVDGTANIAAELDGSTEFVNLKPSQVRKLFSVSNLGSGR
ncbi:MAG: DUF1329 domain-containing protein [Gammaproteobacteria bacterium]